MSLPSGYKRLEYIQSSGTQYINTGFKPNQDTRVVMDVDLLENAAWVALFGARDAVTTKEYSVITSSATAISSRFNTSNVSLTVSTVIGRYLIDKNKALCLINSSQLKNTSSTFQTSYSMYLFDQNDGGVTWSAAKVKLYYCKVYDNGTLVRDFIPCKNASGVVSLWDDVNSVFYQNAGSGTFTAGPEVKGTNKTLIGGTWYGLKSGRLPIDGTSYAIKKMRTLIDRTGYDIKLKDTVTIEITGGCYIFNGVAGTTVTINGVDYHSGPKTIEVEEGTEITCNVRGVFVGGSGLPETYYSWIKFNGSYVRYNNPNNPYVFAATADCSIILADTGDYNEPRGRITITMQ